MADDTGDLHLYEDEPRAYADVEKDPDELKAQLAEAHRNLRAARRKQLRHQILGELPLIGDATENTLGVELQRLYQLAWLTMIERYDAGHPTSDREIALLLRILQEYRRVQLKKPKASSD